MAYKNRTLEGDVSHQIKVYAPPQWFDDLEELARTYPTGRKTRGELIKLAVSCLVAALAREKEAAKA